MSVPESSHIAKVFDAALDAVIVVDRRGDILGWNTAAERMLGWSKAEAAGRNLCELIVPERNRETALRALGEAVRSGASDVVGGRSEWPVCRRDGSELFIESSAFAAEVDGQFLATGFLRDVTDRRRAERLTHTEHSLIELLAGATSLRDALQPVAALLASGLDWPLVELWVTTKDGGSLVRAASSGAADGPLAAFEAAGRHASMSTGEGLVGIAATDSLTIVADAAGEPRASLAGAAVAVGVPAKGRAQGVVLLAAHEARTLHEDERAALQAMARTIGQFADRRLDQRRREAETKAIAAVARATRRLSTTTNLEDARRAIVDAARDVCDGSLAFLAEGEEDGRLAITAMSGELPNLPARDDEHLTWPLFEQVARDGRPRVIHDLAVLGPEAQRARESGIVALLVQPVRRADADMGVLTLAWGRRIDHITGEMRLLLRLLSDEAAIALERASLMSGLRTAAHTEPLTGLPNLRAWDEQLSRELARAERARRPLSIVALDLDDLKSVNDAGGHQAGDRLLREAVAAWQAELRRGDVLARTGGDEFALLLPDCTLMGAQLIADRVRTATPDDHTVSAGVAQWDGQETGPELVARADGALYDAKHAGRDRVVAATPRQPTA